MWFRTVKFLRMFSFPSKIVLSAGVVTSCLLGITSAAHAFTFTTNFNGNPPEGDIFLESVEVGKTLVTNFAFVQDAVINANDPYTGGNSGGGSADVGDESTTGDVVEAPTPSNIVANLGNNNLNNIIDTEEEGAFEFTLTFDQGFNSLLFWERGQNSDLGIRIGGQEFIITRDLFQANNAGYAIDTQEIGDPQNVGSYGLNLADFGISGTYTGPVTLFSNGPAFNGPDFKVVGANVSVPEPATALGLVAVAGACLINRRRKA